MNTQHLPGRLGNPQSTLASDQRGDPRILAAIEAAGALAADVPPVDVSATYEQCLEYCAAFEASAMAAHPLLLEMMPEFPDVQTRTEIIKGVDDNDIKLYIHEPRNRAAGETLPCILHTHGGGMVLMTAEDPMFIRWRNSLADAGLVVVGVEFRNGGGVLGNHPFPAGLNDCAAAARWVYAQRQALGISNIVISGESGGGNLCIATTLQAKRDGWVDEISGVYAMCPYICGQYADPPAHLLSLAENDGYTLSCEQMAALVKVYDPAGEHAANPLAWPLQAQQSDLSGLPPHVISVNELDPLRDEGLVFYRNLLAAGVSAGARTVHGTPHAGDLSFPDIVPEVYGESLRSLVGFAYSLRK